MNDEREIIGPERLRAEIEARLAPLVGLPLSVARRAADMLTVQFGEMRRVERGSVGEWALHVSGAWRLEGPGGIVTGHADVWESAEPRPPEGWTWDDGPNRRDRRMLETLGAPDEFGGARNVTGLLCVESVRASPYGDLRMALSGGYRLRIFPDTEDEAWRLFAHQPDDARHFVVHGGYAVA